MKMNYQDEMLLKLDAAMSKGTYALPSKLLKEEKKASGISSESFSFFSGVKGLGAIALPVIAWLSIVNGGWVYIIIYCVLYAIACCVTQTSSKGGVLGKLSYWKYNGGDAYKNTMNEANYLIPKLREAEKVGGEKGKDMYTELVKYMDDKYGRGKHLLAPYWSESKEMAKRYKEYYEKEMKERMKKYDEALKIKTPEIKKDVLRFANLDKK